MINGRKGALYKSKDAMDAAIYQMDNLEAGIESIYKELNETYEVLVRTADGDSEGYLGGMLDVQDRLYGIIWDLEDLCYRI